MQSHSARLVVVAYASSVTLLLRENPCCSCAAAMSGVATVFSQSVENTKLLMPNFWISTTSGVVKASCSGRRGRGGGGAVELLFASAQARFPHSGAYIKANELAKPHTE